MLERQHRSLKDSLKAAIEDMAEKHQNKWLDHLPFVLLGKRVALQPDLGASPSELTFGKNVRIPGQLLSDPGAPPSEIELSKILQNVRNATNRPAVQPSRHSKPEPPLTGFPPDATHAYTRQHKAQGLQVPYEGPFAIVDRPSKSTVKLDVGTFKSGEKRFEIRHLNDIKFAHPKSLAAPAERPSLGRKPRTSVPVGVSNPTEPGPSPTTVLPGQNRFSEPDNTLPVEQAPPNDLSTNNEPAEIQTRFPARSTRNPNPIYVDALSMEYTGPPTIPAFTSRHTAWSASAADLARINASISTRNRV